MAALTLLPGEFAIATFLTETYLGAVDGGGRTNDAVHTDAQQPLVWQRFKLWTDPTTRIHTPENPEGFVTYAIQTATGNFLTAVSGGNRTTEVLHTDATQALAWERFGLIQQFRNYP